MAAGRTRARCRDDASFQPEKDADIGGGGVRHHTHIGVGTEVARHAGQQQFAYIADVFGAAAGRAAGNAHASVSNAFVSEQTGIRQSLLRRIDAQIRHTPHTSELLARPMFRRRVIFNRRTQLRFQFGETFVPIHYIFARRVLPDSKVLNAVNVVLTVCKLLGMVDAVMDKTAHVQPVAAAQTIGINNAVRHDFLLDDRE